MGWCNCKPKAAWAGTGNAPILARTSSRSGGEAIGPNPADRDRGGVKRHVLTGAKGLPDGVAVTGTNVHEAPQVQAVLDCIPVMPTPAKDNFAAGCCADKSYDAEAICRLLAH